MKKIIKIVIFTSMGVYGVFSTASAQESPFRSCTLKKDKIECIVTTDNTVINDVIFNRGNCESAKIYWEKFTRGNPDGWKRIMEINKTGELDRPYKFGEVATISVYSCNVIEANFQTNKGNWKFTW